MSILKQYLTVFLEFSLNKISPTTALLYQFKKDKEAQLDQY